jgi:glutamate synthase domain-containing protein 1
MALQQMQGRVFAWAHDMAMKQSADLDTAGRGDPRVGDWGLCRADYEKDSCGFGLIASLDDQASHWVVKTAISSLNRLTHRGAIAADGKTGDGCGLLIKQPTAFLRAVARDAKLTLAPLFAAGLVFLNRDADIAADARRVLTEELQREKLKLAGFRRHRRGHFQSQLVPGAAPHREAARRR